MYQRQLSARPKCLPHKFIQNFLSLHPFRMGRYQPHRIMKITLKSAKKIRAKLGELWSYQCRYDDSQKKRTKLCSLPLITTQTQQQWHSTLSGLAFSHSKRKPLIHAKLRVEHKSSEFGQVLSLFPISSYPFVLSARKSRFFLALIFIFFPPSTPSASYLSSRTSLSARELVKILTSAEISSKRCNVFVRDFLRRNQIFSQCRLCRLESIEVRRRRDEAFPSLFIIKTRELVHPSRVCRARL